MQYGLGILKTSYNIEKSIFYKFFRFCELFSYRINDLS